MEQKDQNADLELLLLVNPPSFYYYIAVTLLTELHGRYGYFPAGLRLRPVEDDVPLRYKVAEVINPQTV